MSHATATRLPSADELLALSTGQLVELVQAQTQTIESLKQQLDWFKRHSRAITLVSAGILAIFGIILLTDQLQPVTARMINTLRDNGFGWFVDVEPAIDHGGGEVVLRQPFTRAPRMPHSKRDFAIAAKPSASIRPMAGPVAWNITGSSNSRIPMISAIASPASSASIAMLISMLRCRAT